MNYSAPAHWPAAYWGRDCLTKARWTLGCLRKPRSLRRCSRTACSAPGCSKRTGSAVRCSYQALGYPTRTRSALRCSQGTCWMVRHLRPRWTRLHPPRVTGSRRLAGHLFPAQNDRACRQRHPTEGHLQPAQTPRAPRRSHLCRARRWEGSRPRLNKTDASTFFRPTQTHTQAERANSNASGARKESNSRSACFLWKRTPRGGKMANETRWFKRS
jgi:hypothetical protein